VVALDLDDVALSARKGSLRIYGKGERVREVPFHPELHRALTGWIHERPDWPGAEGSPAVFLNQRGGRLGVRGAHGIITGIATGAGLDDDTTAHVLRHSFATTLVRGGTDLVIVAELLGHARLETTRVYTRPSAEDRAKASSCSPSTSSRRYPWQWGPLTSSIAPFGLMWAVPRLGLSRSPIGDWEASVNERSGLP